MALAVERVADDDLALLGRQRAHRADDARNRSRAGDLVGAATPSRPSGIGSRPACGSRATLSAALWAMRWVEGVRDYGDVRDVVRAYRLLLERGKPGRSL